jgi:hypothetical protein
MGRGAGGCHGRSRTPTTAMTPTEYRAPTSSTTRHFKGFSVRSQSSTVLERLFCQIPIFDHFPSLVQSGYEVGHFASIKIE